MDKLTNLTHLRKTAQNAQDMSAKVAGAAAAAIEELDGIKQNKLTGAAGRFVGFNAAGEVTDLAPPVRGLTQAEYDALPEAEKAGLCVITDADPSTGGTAPMRRALTLIPTRWDTDRTQTVTVPGVLADESAQLIQPIPSLASQTAYYEAGIVCTGQGENTLTFRAQTVPATVLGVYVVIQEISA